MTEQDLIELRFERVDVTAEESGYKRDWYYYTYDFTNRLSLISNDDIEAEITKGWYVEFFNTEDKIRFTDTYDVQELIKIINRAIK